MTGWIDEKKQRSFQNRVFCSQAQIECASKLIAKPMSSVWIEEAMASVVGDLVKK